MTEAITSLYAFVFLSVCKGLDKERDERGTRSGRVVEDGEVGAFTESKQRQQTSAPSSVTETP